MLRIDPSTVEDLSTRQSGSEVYFNFINTTNKARQEMLNTFTSLENPDIKSYVCRVFAVVFGFLVGGH